MGKPTGYMEYSRKENAVTDPLARLKNYNEFHEHLSEQERCKQSARCMNCGVPFCQSGIMLGGAMTGCPLHNLIPEWNDDVYNKNYDRALSRLLKTNDFPEFTGRVCPALCEKACVVASFGEAVTTRDNELFIIEYAFKHGLIKAQPPAVRTDKKIAVIGSGPSGLSVAQRLNRRGHNVTVFERDDLPGGLLTYGIPNMKLDKGVVARRIKLMEEEGITFKTNANVGVNVSAEQILSEYDAVVICCGAKKPRSLGVEGENMPGVMFAVDFLTNAEKYVMGSISEEQGKLATGKKVIVTGGGDTGNDCVATCLRQGASSLIQLEIMPSPPEERSANNPWPEWPRVKKTDYGQEEYIAVYGHDPRIYQTTVNRLFEKDGRLQAVETVQVQFKDGKLNKVAGTEKLIETDLLIVAAGFVGCEDYVATAFDIPKDGRGRIIRDGYKVADSKIFVAGDAGMGQSLVVRAIAEGRECAKAVDKFLMGYSNM